MGAEALLEGEEAGDGDHEEEEGEGGDVGPVASVDHADLVEGGLGESVVAVHLRALERAAPKAVDGVDEAFQPVAHVRDEGDVVEHPRHVREEHQEPGEEDRHASHNRADEHPVHRRQKSS